MPGTEASAAVGDWQNSCSTHVLRNGTEIVIRAVRPDDKERFRAAFRKLGSASIYTRFFGYKNELSEAELEQATNVDFDRVVALVATTGLAEQETIIAGARYATYEPPLKSAEVAFTVEEDTRGSVSRLHCSISSFALAVPRACPDLRPTCCPATGRCSLSLHASACPCGGNRPLRRSM